MLSRIGIVPRQASESHRSRALDGRSSCFWSTTYVFEQRIPANADLPLDEALCTDIAALGVALGFSGAASAPVAHAEGQSEPTYGVIHETKVPVPMRDGIRLGAEIYRPDALGKFPVITDLRYFRGGFQNERGQFFARRGYVVALLDSRGRGDSEGLWDNYVNEPKDGYDAQQWIGVQPWSERQDRHFWPIVQFLHASSCRRLWAART